MRSCSLSLIKLILYVFNLCVCVIGIAFIAVGAYILSSLDDLKNFLDSGIIHSSGILIGTGALIFLISFFGCCGAKRENRCMLDTYIAFLVIIIILEIVVGALAVHYKNNFVKDVFKDTLTKSMKSTDASDQDAWNAIQKGFKCCGVNNELDWTQNGKVIPESCYGDKNDITSIYTEGCYDTIQEFINKNAGVLIGIAFGLVAVKFVGVIFATCMCNGIKRERH